MVKTLLLTALLTASTFAGENLEVDKHPYYIGIGATGNQTTAKSSSSDFLGHSRGEFSNMGIGVSAGYLMFENERLSTFVEAKVGKSYWMEDSEDISTTSFGVFIKPVFEIVSGLDVYGLAGVAATNWDGRNQDITKWGVGLGLGGQITMTEHVAIFGEYVGYPLDADLLYLNDEVDFRVLTLGMKYKF